MGAKEIFWIMLHTDILFSEIKVIKESDLI